MFLLDRMLVGSIRFVLDKLTAAAAEELDDDGALKQILLEAQMKLELGEMSTEEFADVEREVLARLREIHERRNGPSEGGLALQEGVSVVGATAELAGDLHEMPAPPEVPDDGFTIEVPAPRARAGAKTVPPRAKRPKTKTKTKTRTRAPRAGAVRTKNAPKRRGR